MLVLGFDDCTTSFEDKDGLSGRAGEVVGESVHESDDLAILEGWYSSVGMWIESWMCSKAGARYQYMDKLTAKPGWGEARLTVSVSRFTSVSHKLGICELMQRVYFLKSRITVSCKTTVDPGRPLINHPRPTRWQEITPGPLFQ